MLNWIVILKIILATTLPFLAFSLLHLVIHDGAVDLTFMGIVFGLASGMVVAESQIFKLRRRQSHRKSGAERVDQ